MAFFLSRASQLIRGVGLTLGGELSMKRLFPAALGACLALLALSLASCGSRRREPDPRLGANLELRNFAAIDGTDVFRAELVEDGGSSYGQHTSNVLFIESSGEGRWLLPDNDHSIDEYPISRTSSSMAEEQRPVAIAALVRPASGELEGNVLLILDPTGRTVHKVAEKVDDVLGVTLHGDRDCSILYTQAGPRYVVATFARDSLTKRRESVVSVPELK